MKKQFLVLTLALLVLTTLPLSAIADSPYDPYTDQNNVVYSNWHLDKIGVADAWSRGFTGSRDIVVAVIDTGIGNNPDLIDNIDYINGIDIPSGTTGPAGICDNSGHGTHVSGIIGADLNGQYVNGIAKYITVVPVIYNNRGLITSIDIMRTAIDYAVETLNADIINISAKLKGDSVADAFESYPNTLFVVSGGNSHTLLSLDPDNTAKVNHPDNVIVVGASSATDQRASFSNYDINNIELFAPGVGISSTYLNNTFTALNGTSMASPMVAAAAALIMSHATHLTPQEVRQIIIDQVQPVSSLSNCCISGGRLDLTRIVDYLYDNDPHRTPYTKGDITGDGQITSADYSLCKRHVLGTYTLTGSELTAADVNDDGQITSRDYMMIQRYALQTYYFPPY